MLNHLNESPPVVYTLYENCKVHSRWLMTLKFVSFTAYDLMK